MVLSDMTKYFLQGIDQNCPFRSSLCTNRTIIQSVAFGGVSGILCHYWYNHLDRIYSGGNHRQIKIVIKKILCDQIIFSPILIVACLLAACMMNGRETQNIYKEVTHKGKISRWNCSISYLTRRLQTKLGLQLLLVL